jgi:DNA-binding response OmpR family regulator
MRCTHPSLAKIETITARLLNHALHMRLVASGKLIPTILLTAFPQEADRVRALRAGVTCYLAKPFEETELATCVASALASARPGRRPS